MMNLYRYSLSNRKVICLVDAGGMIPKLAEPVSCPFAPLVFVVQRDPQVNRGIFAIQDISELEEEENESVLLPGQKGRGELAEFISLNGATVLNTAFTHAYTVLERFLLSGNRKLRLELVGLGDVGGTLLTALKLLGSDKIESISIFDFNEKQCQRYEMELNQVLGVDCPKIIIASFDDLFEGDLFLFTASRGVPPIGTQGDVRLLQFEKNKDMLQAYAGLARRKQYSGLFCQISDPVDLLARSVFLMSNKNEDGCFDANGLLPEQVLGFGLGVMSARAAYAMQKRGIPHEELRAYGPHGQGLIIANSISRYDEALSLSVTEETVKANLAVRDLGFKPYIAPAISSAAISILNMIKGETFYTAAPLGGIYFGAKSRITANGLLRIREQLPGRLINRIKATMQQLKEAEPLCQK